MSFLIWNPELEQIEFSLKAPWAGEVTVLFDGPFALRALVTLQTSGSVAATTTIYSSCGESGTTKPDVDGGLTTVPVSTDTLEPYFPKVTIRPLFKAGRPCGAGGIADTPFVAPNERTLIGDGAKVQHEAWRFISPDGGIVEIIIVIKDEGAGDPLRKLSEYSKRMVEAVKGSRPKKGVPGPGAPGRRRELASDGEEVGPESTALETSA